MPSIDITISTPVLTTGQYFKERHRLLPAGSWSGYTNRSNAQFTLTGLSVGFYEFEFIVVNADGTQCPPRSFTKEVKEFACMDVTVEQLNDPYRIKIAYALPPGASIPPCGIQARYQDVTGGGWAVYNVTTNPYYIYPPNTTPRDLRVNVNALLCEGQLKSCYNEIVPKPEPVPCVPMTAGLTLQFNGYTPGGWPKIGIQIIGNQSTPHTPTTTFYMKQNPVNIQPNTNAGSLTYTTTFFQQPTHAHGFGMLCAPTTDNKYHIEVHFTDICGKMHHLFGTFYLG